MQEGKPMTESELRELAAQLRKPEGEIGKQVGIKLNEGNRLINQYAFDSLQLKPSDKVVEIGMGNGLFVGDLIAAAPEIQYWGCDFSELMVEESRCNNADTVASGQTEFLVATADSLPFDDRSIDAVVTINTLYFWDNPESTLTSIRRILKPGGILVVGIRPERSMKQYPFVRFGFNLYSAETASALLERSGFKVESVCEFEEPARQMSGVDVDVESLVLRCVRPLE